MLQQTGRKTVYFDCYSGISGDMALGALLDLGLEIDRLRAVLAGLKLDGYRLEAEKVKRGVIAGTRARVILEQADLPGRNLAAVLELITKAALPAAVKEKSGAVFTSLAEAEAAVHGVTVDKVHFHEVGALDAIVDIVGVTAALELLNIDQIYCSPLPLGSGEVETDHGRLPLPAPATLQLIAMRKAPVRGSSADFELVTPTGAALVTTLACDFGPLPDITVEAVGYGAGSKDPAYPNHLRLVVGRQNILADLYEEEVLQLETNIDDLNPEIYGYLMEKLFAAGALDVYVMAVQMKKDRPAVQLTVLIPPHLLEQIRDLVFTETSTLGLRLSRARKIMRPRAVVTVETKWGPARVKYCPQTVGEQPLHFAPEYEDCRRIAGASGLPLKEVYRLVEFLFRNQR